MNVRKWQNRTVKVGIVSLFVVGTLWLVLARDHPSGNVAAQADLVYLKCGCVDRPGPPLVHGRLGGIYPAVLAVDSGFTTCALSETAVRLLRRSPGSVIDSHRTIRVSGITVPIVEVASIKVGNIIIPRVECAVVPDANLLSAVQAPIDGVLGMNLLRHMSLLLDFSAGRLRMWLPGGLSDQQLQQAGFGSVTALPLSWERSLGRFHVMARFNGVQTSMLLDTGSVYSTIAYGDDGSGDKSGRSPPIVLPTFAGAVQAVRARVGDLWLGGVHLKNAQLWRPIRQVSMVPRIGIDGLCRFRALMDFPRKRLFLCPTNEPLSIDAPCGALVIPMMRDSLPVVIGQVGKSPPQRLIMNLGLDETSVFADPTAALQLGTQALRILPGLADVPAKSFRFHSGAPPTEIKYQGISGIVGYDALRPLAVVLDYTSGVLLFVPGERAKDLTGVIASGKHWIRIPILKRDAQHYIVGMIGHRRTRFLLTAFFGPVAAAAQSGPPLDQGPVVSMTLGNLPLHGPLIFSRGDSGTVSSFGLELLRQFHIVIDLKHNVLYLASRM